MITYVLIIGSCVSPTSKVPRRDAKILKEAEHRQGKPLPELVMSWRRRKHLTLPSMPVLKPSRIQWGLCGCSLPLIRGQPLGIKKVQKLIYLYIYVDMESHKGDKAECQERRSRASAFFHDINRLPSTEQPDLVKVPWMGFVTICLLNRCLWLNGWTLLNHPQISLHVDRIACMITISFPQHKFPFFSYLTYISSCVEMYQIVSSQTVLN